MPRPGPHLLQLDFGGLSFRDFGVIALDPGWLQAKPSCSSKLSQFRSRYPGDSPHDTECSASLPRRLSLRKCILTDVFGPNPEANEAGRGPMEKPATAEYAEQEGSFERPRTA